MKKFFKEFKAFITRGNVIDMAVGVIIGGAFTAIVTALTSHILQPLINWVIAAISGGENALESAVTILKPTYVEGVLDLANSIYIDWGALISAIINFLLVALILFSIIKVINRVSNVAKDTVTKLKSDEEKRYIALRKQGLSKKEAKAQIAKEKEEKALAEQKALEEAKANEKPPVTDVMLLEEIRDLLKEKK